MKTTFQLKSFLYAKDLDDFDDDEVNRLKHSFVLEIHPASWFHRSKKPVYINLVTLQVMKDNSSLKDLCIWDGDELINKLEELRFTNAAEPWVTYSIPQLYQSIRGDILNILDSLDDRRYADIFGNLLVHNYKVKDLPVVDRHIRIELTLLLKNIPTIFNGQASYQ